MPFWDRDLDLVVVPKADAKSLNGLMAVVERYHVGTIVSVEVGDNRAAGEWLDVIAAKQIEVIESGLGIGIEDGVSLSTDESGWVRIDTGVTGVGIGTPGSGSAARVDVLVLEKVADQTVKWFKASLPSIVVTQSPVEPEKLVEGVVFASARARAVELTFDGAQWSVHAAP